MIDLFLLDQSGFAPTLPTGDGWGRRGHRLVGPHEAPQGRRVNVVGALAPSDPTGSRFRFETRRTAEGRYDAIAHLAVVARVAPAGIPTHPCGIVLDNYSGHHRHPVTAATPALAAREISVTFLPPYRPELNPIEAPWRHLTHRDLPERRYPTDAALQAAIAQALAHRARTLRESPHDLPRPA